MKLFPVERAINVPFPQFSQIYPAFCKAPFPIEGDAVYLGLPPDVDLGAGAGCGVLGDN